jgi:hypothetical protein
MKFQINGFSRKVTKTGGTQIFGPVRSTGEAGTTPTVRVSWPIDAARVLVHVRKAMPLQPPSLKPMSVEKEGSKMVFSLKLQFFRHGVTPRILSQCGRAFYGEELFTLSMWQSNE